MKHLLISLLVLIISSHRILASEASYTESINGVNINYTVYNNKEVWLTSVSQLATGSFTIPASLHGCPVTQVRDYAFRGCSGIKSFTIPDTVRKIGAGAFSDCNNLDSITLGANMTTLDNIPFDVKNIHVSASSRSYSEINGVLFNKSKTALLKFPQKREGFYSIPNGVKTIRESSFSFCRLDSIYIPPTVSEVEYDAFTYCKNLRDVYCPKHLDYITILYRNSGIYALTRYSTYGCFDEETIKHYKFHIMYWTYLVNFSANGGKLPNGKKMAAQKFTYGESSKLRKNVFKRTGFVFAGWATSKSNAKKGVIAYTNAQKVKNLRYSGKITLYAVWAKSTYKVAFFANGGKGKMPTQTFSYGKAKKLNANKFKRRGYVFLGWAKSKALAKKCKVAFDNEASVKNLLKTGKTIKLYAVWVKI